MAVYLSSFSEDSSQKNFAELIQIIECKREEKIKIKNNLIYVFNESEICIYTNSGTLKDCLKFENFCITKIAVGECLALATNKGILFEDKKLIPYDNNSEYISLEWRDNFLIVHQIFAISIIKNREKLHFIDISAGFVDYVPLLSAFFVLSNSNMIIFYESGEKSEFDTIVPEKSLIEISGDLLFISNSQEFFVYSLTKLLLIKSYDLQHPILAFKYEKICILDCNLLILTKTYTQTLNLCIISENSFKIVQKIQVNHCELLSGKFVCMQSKIFSICEPNLCKNLKSLIYKSKFVEAASIFEAQSTEILQEFISEIFSETFEIELCTRICQFLQYINNNKQIILDSLYSYIVSNTFDSINNYERVLDLILPIFINNKSNSNEFQATQLKYCSQKLKIFKFSASRLQIFPNFENWLLFRDSNDFFLIETLFKLNEIRLGISLCMLHHPFPNEINFSALFDTIPLESPIHLYSRWVQDKIIPYLGSEQLENLEKIIKERVKNHEKIECSPKKAYLCSKIFTDSLPIALNLGFSQDQQIPILSDFQINSAAVRYRPSIEFLDMQKSLEKLVDLVKNYKILIRLENVKSETWTSIGMKILDSVLTPHGDFLSIKELLLKYCKDKNINKDLVIKQFLAEKAMKVYEDNKSVDKAIVNVIKLIENNEIRAEVSIEMLQFAAKPFSEACNDLLEFSLTYSSALFGNFQILKDLKTFKNICSQYTIEEINANDKFQVLMLIIFILRSNKNSAVDDAFKVLKIVPNLKRSEIFVYYISGCINFEEKISCDEIFNKLVSEESGFLIAQSIIDYCLSVLDEIKVNSNWYRKRYLAACKISLKTIEIFKSYRTSLNEIVIQIENLYKLACNYDIFISHRDYLKKSQRKKILISYIPEYLECINKSKSSIIGQSLQILKPQVSKRGTFSFLQSLANFLSFPINEVYLQLSIFASKIPNLWTNTIDYLKQIASIPLKTKEIAIIIEISIHLLTSINEPSVPCLLKPIFESISLKCPVNDIKRLQRIISDLNICSNIFAQVSGLLPEDPAFPESISENICLHFEEIRETVQNFYKFRCLGSEKYTRVLVDKLIQNKGLRTAMQILLNSPQEYLVQGEINKIVTNLFENMSKSRHIDHEQALMFMIEMREPQVLENYTATVLEKFYDHATVQSICSVSKDYSILVSRETPLKIWKNSEKKSRWKKIFSDLNIKVDVASINSNNKPKVIDLIEKILAKKKNLKFCCEICKECEIPETDAIEIYLKYIIVFPEVKPEILHLIRTNSSSLESTIKSQYPFKEDYKVKVNKYLKKLDQKNFENFLLNSCLPKIVQVDYPRLSFIFSYLTSQEKINKRILPLLKFLSEYNRNSEPTDKEKKSLNESNPFLSQEIKIVYECLNRKFITLESFLSLSEREINIYREVRVSNLHKIKTLKKILKLDSDELSFNAIENEFKHNHIDKICAICPRFAEIEPYLLRVKNYKLRLELLDRISIYYQYTEEYIKVIAVQIEILENQILYTEDFSEKFNLERELTDYECKKIIGQTKIELFNNHIDDVLPMSLEKPIDLIKSIYSLMIPQQNLMNRENLLKMIVKICEIHSLEIKEVNEHLFKEAILSDDIQNQSLEQIRMTAAYCYTKSLYLRGSSMKKILFLAEALGMAESISILKEMIKMPETGDPQHLLLAKALSVLAKIDPNELKYLHFPCEFQYFIKICWYLADFDVLKIPMNIDTFCTYNKLRLCQTFFLKYSEEIRTLQLISCILIDHQIVDASLYVDILRSLLSLNDFYAVLLIVHQIIINGFYSSLKNTAFDEFLSSSLKKITEFIAENKGSAYLEILNIVCVEAEIQFKQMQEIILRLLIVDDKEFKKIAIELAENFGNQGVSGILAYFYLNGFEEFIKFIREEEIWTFDCSNTNNFIVSISENESLLLNFVKRLPLSKIGHILSILKSSGKGQVVGMIEENLRPI